MPGAPRSCGKRTSASFGSSPRATARCEQRAHRRHDALDHLAVIEFGDVRKARPFGQHQPDDVLAVRAENLADESRRQPLGNHAQGQIAQRRGFQRGDHRAQLRADQFLEQISLSRKYR